ncbi:MAG: hypothetical protein Ct9H300mP6_14480 [Gammaproteobacteria bacterium]|nr:MAG: hypothetical protein Ct9H300mP6_14480 [Gammaproteobacteria bacterium]
MYSNLKGLQNNEPETKHIDALIVGAGPCGIFQIFELGLLGIDSVIIDSMERLAANALNFILINRSMIFLAFQFVQLKNWLII